uniref:Uncharacterized protein n=1 Tax=Haplochromis burtoni TaxID=8153 RepID=A0A3Q3BUC1_HAPBU
MHKLYRALFHLSAQFFFSVLFFPVCSVTALVKTTLHQHIECDQQPVVTALLGFAPLAVDGAMAHHLRHCPYHFRLFKTELVSSQELPESHYGQPLQSLKILGAASSSSL